MELRDVRVKVSEILVKAGKLLRERFDPDHEGNCERFRYTNFYLPRELECKV